MRSHRNIKMRSSRIIDSVAHGITYQYMKICLFRQASLSHKLISMCSCVQDAKLQKHSFRRSWHYMPMHEKIFAWTSKLVPQIYFHALASLCTLKIAYKEKNIKTSEVIFVKANINLFRENEIKKSH